MARFDADRIMQAQALRGESYTIQQVQDGNGRLYWRGKQGGKDLVQTVRGWDLQSITDEGRLPHDFDTKVACIAAIEDVVKEKFNAKKDKARRVVYTEDRRVDWKEGA